MDDTSATITIISRFRAVPASSSILVSLGTVVERYSCRQSRDPPRKALARECGQGPPDSSSNGADQISGPPGRACQPVIRWPWWRFFNRLVSRSPVDGVLALVSKNRGIVYVREKVETGSSDGPVEVPVGRYAGRSSWP